ncbi:hypothetical protein [Algoriphagus lacus]|uniref:hypothetical protein n=1 Tax=Algoriphagus lacus TaxID=2056311 RepID=UPI001313F118|nr:hypothetical protein [Algoriphagus lacus]
MTIASILLNFEVMGVLLFGRLNTKEMCVKICKHVMPDIFIKKVAVVRIMIEEFKN